jgi:serine/threonine protein kinase/tetratricopeptide (TPR) repeat protein
MTPELYQRLKPLYEAALELPKDRRATYSVQACGDDQDLRRELQALLAAHETGTGTLDRPLFDFKRIGDPNPDALPEGTLLLGRFEILRHRGSGGMGDVYEARDLLLGPARIALKTIRPSIAQNPAILARFKEEVKLARQVNGPNICRIYELYVPPPEAACPCAAFLTMEFLDGVTLADRLAAEGPVAPKPALEIAAQLCAALQAIHQAGVVHRDLKPNNVMLLQRNGAEHVVVMDFGLARTASPDSASRDAPNADTGITIPGAIMGTPAYMAPEQFEAGEITPATDIYALGVVLYQLVTGQQPFAAPTPFAAAVRRGRRPDSPSSLRKGVPPVWDHVICKCIEFDPKNRYQSSDDVDRALRLPSLILRIRQRPVASAAAALGTAALLSSSLLIPAIGDRARGILFSSRIKHIAVLPFDEAGASPETEALGDGLEDSLSGKLANSYASDQSLWVVPASEVRQRNVRNPSAALREFGATIVVQGRFERKSATNHLKLTLIDSEKTREIGYIDEESEASDLSSLQDKAVTRLGRLMNVSTSETAERGDNEPSNQAAYEDYLTGLGYYERYDLPGHIDLAIQALERSVAKDANYAPAYAALAQAYGMQFQEHSDPSLLQRAEHYARKAVELDNRSSTTYVALGQVDELTSDREAIEDFERAASLDPRSPEAAKGLARSFQHAGRYPDAETAYAKSVALRPDDWKGYNELGNFYEETGRPRDAIGQYTKALRLAPDNSWVYTNLGITYMDFDDARSLQQAEALLKKSFAIAPTDIALENLGVLYMMKRQFSDSLNASNAAIQMDGKRYVTWCNLALAYEWTNDRRAALAARARAIDLAQTALLSRPKDYNAAAMLAALYAKAGSKKLAWEQIHKASEAISLDRDACSHIASAYALLGERHRATTYLNQAVALGLNKAQLGVYPELLAIAGIHDVTNN